jgi:hypothetical protein
MAGLTTCQTDSFRNEVMTATHNFTHSTGNDFKVALFVANASIVGTYGKASTNYSQMGSDELATGSGYTRPGIDLTAANNVTPTIVSHVAGTYWSTSPQWTSATFITRGCMFYNNTAGGNSVVVYDFGADQNTGTGGTITITIPNPFITFT